MGIIRKDGSFTPTSEGEKDPRNRGKVTVTSQLTGKEAPYSSKDLRAKRAGKKTYNRYEIVRNLRKEAQEDFNPTSQLLVDTPTKPLESGEALQEPEQQESVQRTVQREVEAGIGLFASSRKSIPGSNFEIPGERPFIQKAEQKYMKPLKEFESKAETKIRGVSDALFGSFSRAKERIQTVTKDAAGQVEAFLTYNKGRRVVFDPFVSTAKGFAEVERQISPFEQTSRQKKFEQEQKGFQQDLTRKAEDYNKIEQRKAESQFKNEFNKQRIALRSYVTQQRKRYVEGKINADEFNTTVQSKTEQLNQQLENKRESITTNAQKQLDSKIDNLNKTEFIPKKTVERFATSFYQGVGNLAMYPVRIPRMVLFPNQTVEEQVPQIVTAIRTDPVGLAGSVAGTVAASYGLSKVIGSAQQQLARFKKPTIKTIQSGNVARVKFAKDKYLDVSNPTMVAKSKGQLYIVKARAGAITKMSKSGKTFRTVQTTGLKISPARVSPKTGKLVRKVGRPRESVAIYKGSGQITPKKILAGGEFKQTVSLPSPKYYKTSGRTFISGKPIPAKYPTYAFKGGESRIVTKITRKPGLDFKGKFTSKGTPIGISRTEVTRTALQPSKPFDYQGYTVTPLGKEAIFQTRGASLLGSEVTKSLRSFFKSKTGSYYTPTLSKPTIKPIQTSKFDTSLASIIGKQAAIRSLIKPYQPSKLVAPLFIGAGISGGLSPKPIQLSSPNLVASKIGVSPLSIPEESFISVPESDITNIEDVSTTQITQITQVTQQEGDTITNIINPPGAVLPPFRPVVPLPFGGGRTGKKQRRKAELKAKKTRFEPDIVARFFGQVKKQDTDVLFTGLEARYIQPNNKKRKALRI